MSGMEPIKQSIKATAPWLIHGVRLARWAKHQVTFPVVATAVELRAHGRVMSGPFAGMRVPGTGIGPGFYTQLLGIYEKSLVPVIEAVIGRPPATIVDAGAGSGYYALGLAMRCPESRIIAYEIDPTRADVIRKYERLNHVEGHVEVRGACTTEALMEDFASPPAPFLLMDVEGAEDTLLDPARIPGLRGAEILVELHEQYVPGVTRRLQDRFADTHVQSVLQAEHPPPDRELVGWVADQPGLRSIVRRMIDEGRGVEMAWLHLTPRN